MLNITRDGVPTLAGVLNFALYPQGYFPQLGITAIVVPGTQIGDTAVDSARFINNKRIEGTIPAMAEEAVSYTHLDVYKRQHVLCSAFHHRSLLSLIMCCRCV